MKRKLMFLMTFLFIGIGLVTAQTSRVTGLVTSEEDGQPVVGASILVNGTTLGTITDIDGKFTITNVPSSARLIDLFSSCFFVFSSSILLFFRCFVSIFANCPVLPVSFIEISFISSCLFSSLFFSLILRWGGNILPEFLMNFPVFSLLFQLSSALNKNMFDDVLISVFCGL